jgi:hypothetical protein
VDQQLTSLPGLNNGGNAKILGKQTDRNIGSAAPIGGENEVLS